MHKSSIKRLISFIMLLSVLGILYPQFRKLIFFKTQDKHILSINENSSYNLERLRSLPYLSWSSEKVDSEITGVIKYDINKSFFAYNLYTDYDQNAYLMDMTGQILHRWQFPFRGRWEQVELLNNGEIVAICVNQCFIKLNRNSEVIWMYKINAHHDIAVLSNNTYLVPARARIIYNAGWVIFDSILHLSEQGEVLDEWSTLTNFNKLKRLHYPSELDKNRNIMMIGINTFARYKNRVLNVLGRLGILRSNSILQMSRKDKLEKLPRFNLTNSQNRPQKSSLSFGEQLKNYLKNFLVGNKEYDYYHLNAIEIIPDTPLGRKDVRFQKGNYLVCLNHVSLILILDKCSKEIVWSWGPGILDWPHDPTMLENGNILIFDNGAHRSYSRVLEINPINGHIVWDYKANPKEGFYSEYWGSCQRLPNGNTLICESSKGHVFEIASNGEIVWEFLNPETDNGMRKGIYRMNRIPKEKIEEWLNSPIK